MEVRVSHFFEQEIWDTHLVVRVAVVGGRAQKGGCPKMNKSVGEVFADRLVNGKQPSRRRDQAPRQRLNSTLAFTPPKPKPLEMACSIPMSRAAPRTMSTPSARGSACCRLRVAGTL